MDDSSLASSAIPGHIPKRGARACTACLRGKNRCEGEAPCRRCLSTERPALRIRETREEKWPAVIHRQCRVRLSRLGPRLNEGALSLDVRCRLAVVGKIKNSNKPLLRHSTRCWKKPVRGEFSPVNLVGDVDGLSKRTLLIDK
ncbi:hypothetical protein BGY98DRAFT_682506 [Russula aff. rugulosa BPL654]|nr:hypothetical protein BGY98DRAFT_682506 [Russula aff. rugulosa BPL654]